MALSLERSFRKAKKLTADGDREEAAKVYREILQDFPQNRRAREALAAIEERAVAANADALAARIDTLLQQKQYGPAIELGEKAVRIVPDHARLRSLLGIAFANTKRFAEAVPHFRRALELDPGYDSARLNLAISCRETGDYQTAENLFLSILEKSPDHSAALSQLSLLYLEEEKPEKAKTHLDRLIRLNPSDSLALNRLGMVLEAEGKSEEAHAHYQRAIEQNPRMHEAWYNLGSLSSSLDRFDDAIQCFGMAVTLRPDYPRAFNNLGSVYWKLQDYEKALQNYRKAVELDPKSENALQNLAEAQIFLKQRESAIETCTKLITLKPDHYVARGNRMHQLAHLCRWDEMEEDRPFLPLMGIEGSPMMTWSLYPLEDDPERHFIRAKRFAEEALSEEPVPLPPPPSRRPERITIGYFSADYHYHATMMLMIRMFELHDRSAFRIIAYSFGPDRPGDIMLERLKACVDDFRDVRRMQPKEIAERARSDGVDIAVDLKGFTHNNRFRTFAFRAAPVQISYIGHPGTTGADYMDYMIADRVTVPEGYERYYSEKLIFLPGAYQVNDDGRPISGEALTRSRFGLPENGFVFASINNAYKIQPDQFDIWMRLLGKVDGSVLWLLRTADGVEKRLRAEAERRGVSGDRIIFSDYLDPPLHIARFRLVDLYLDTFSVNAHTSASDALWGGLPVLTMTGRSFAARVAASLLSAVGLPEMITQTPEEYEALALDLATDPEKLSAIRQKLARNIPDAPLFDSEKTTRNIEAAYEAAYARYLAGEDPDHIEL